jgi:nicotinamidase-related amidase
VNGKAHKVPTALVVVDMQCAFLEGAGAIPASGDVVAAARQLLERARSAQALVIHLQNDGPTGAPDEPGTPGWEFALRTAQGEPVLRKQKDDGFDGTDLGSLLERQGVQSMVIAGLLSEMCVASTARTAMTRGLTVVLPRGGHGTYDISADETQGIAVPAAQVARVAEWSLGDALVVPDVAAVQFAPASPPHP